jgi:hypothetical protein
MGRRRGRGARPAVAHPARRPSAAAHLPGWQALARLEELRRLRPPFWNVEVRAGTAHAADLRFLTADDLHVRLRCEVREQEPRHLKALRLDWIGPEEIPLMDWDQVPDLMAHYRVPALSVALTDGAGEPVARAWGADPDDGRYVLEGLVATTLEFTRAGEPVLRQGAEQWRLQREPV